MSAAADEEPMRAHKGILIVISSSRRTRFAAPKLCCPAPAPLERLENFSDEVTEGRSSVHSFIHSFIPAISIAPLQVLYYSEALPTTARILYRSFTPKRTGNCR